jgi:transposase InsO family protein
LPNEIPGSAFGLLDTTQSFGNLAASAIAAPTAPDRLWVADISYVRTWEGWLYVAVVLDCYSRRVVGFAIGDHLRAGLVVECFYNRPRRHSTLGYLSPAEYERINEERNAA